MNYKIIDVFLAYLITLPLLLTLLCPMFLISFKLDYKLTRFFVILMHGLSFLSSLTCFLILFKVFSLELFMVYSRTFTSSLGWVSLGNPKYPPLE